ncbi:MAG: hypothetical protein COB38_01165 [Gammaproteobacteria bacterium]|nr:MAG: hypothetical protein COB38_01165 [Gammaproteobacteria bacterium]
MSTYNVLGNSLPIAPPGGNSLPEFNSRGRQGLVSSSNHVKTNETSVTKEIQNASTLQSVDTLENARPELLKTDKNEVNNQIEELQQFNQSINRSLQFKVDEELGVTIVRVVDKETDELIRQFPPEELINLSRRLKELNEQGSSNQGVLLEEFV